MLLCKDRGSPTSEGASADAIRILTSLVRSHVLELKVEMKQAVLPCPSFLSMYSQSKDTGSHTDGLLQPLLPEVWKTAEGWPGQAVGGKFIFMLLRM